MDLEKLLENVASYNITDIEKIKKAYQYAYNLHNGQFRQSGEPYIIHPLNVAYILSELHADSDTLCAGLLHDTLEDTNTTKEDIAHEFNPTIASLVDGVTKLSKMNFSSKQDLNMANTRKIILGLTEDVRIILIKLADRLHNMRTLEYKSEFKQKENSVETMEIFVPLAYYLGTYRIKQELEDRSFYYLDREMYEKIAKKKAKITKESDEALKEMVTTIDTLLTKEQIEHALKVRTKNIYGIYKALNKGQKITDIHDLLSLKVMVESIKDCYLTLGLIHGVYHPINYRFKDYIVSPKTNMYQSLHTTLFGPKEKLVQTQIRTFDMDKIASFGLATYWDMASTDARIKMQEDLKNKYQFFKSLEDINSSFNDNKEFVSRIKAELFADKVYVYTMKGDRLELPKGATIVDFAYKIHTQIGNKMVGAIVNNEYVPFDYVLNNNDRVRIITDELAMGPKQEWLECSKTSTARKKIKEFLR